MAFTPEPERPDRTFDVLRARALRDVRPRPRQDFHEPEDAPTRKPAARGDAAARAFLSRELEDEIDG